MKIELAAGFPASQRLIELEVPEGSTVWEAISVAVEDHGFLSDLPEHPLDPSQVGIFGQLCSADRVLQPGDRIELYRPLTADPKEVRRELAKIERAKRNSVV